MNNGNEGARSKSTLCGYGYVDKKYICRYMKISLAYDSARYQALQLHADCSSIRQMTTSDYIHFGHHSGPYDCAGQKLLRRSGRCAGHIYLVTDELARRPTTAEVQHSVASTTLLFPKNSMRLEAKRFEGLFCEEKRKGED